MIPLTTDGLRWGFVCGRINALEDRLLSKDFFLTLVSHARTEDLLRQLQETPLQEFVVPGSAWQDWSQVIDKFFHARVTSLRDNSPDPGVADLFLLHWDFLNLKRAFAKLETYGFLPGTLSAERLAALTDGDVAVLPKPFRDALGALGLHGADTLENLPLDMMLDGAYLRLLLAYSERLKVPLVTAGVRDLVFARALTELWRALRSGQSLKHYQQHFLPLGALTPALSEVIAAGDPKSWPAVVRGRLGELLAAALEQPEDEQVPHFEHEVANHLSALARRGQGQVAGPERVYSYLTALAAEAYNMKLVVCGRLNRVDAGVLKRRLRECYG